MSSCRLLDPDIDCVTPYEAFAIFPCEDCGRHVGPPEIVVEVIWGFASKERHGLAFYCEKCLLNHLPKELKEERPQMELFQ